MEEFKWELPKQKERPVGDGDLRIVNLPVKVIFEWSDKIVADWGEDGTPLEYTSGYIMKVLPKQSFVYKDEDSTFIASTFKKASRIGSVRGSLYHPDYGYSSPKELIEKGVSVYSGLTTQGDRITSWEYEMVDGRAYIAKHLMQEGSVTLLNCH